MKFLIKNTKIVSTFGPSITFDYKYTLDNNSPEVKALLSKVHSLIAELILGGINCVRFNFSHGSPEENTTRLKVINGVQKLFLDKQASANISKYKFLRPVAFMADTKGPEIRVFDMGPAPVSYSLGQEIIVNCIERKQGSSEGFSVIDATGKYNMANDCIVGNVILVEDGKLTLEILEVDKAKGAIKVKVKNAYSLKTNKRINLPGADYSMDFLSEKDIADIKYAVDNGFEYVALSFANSKKNVQDVKDLLTKYCQEKNIPNVMKVYSKIETLKSCECIDEIIEASDGIMIARGDLGLEIPYYVVPFWTKEIIRKCRHVQKPVITATQMLDSLERNIVATRAEVSDVYRAAEMGSDCTMLSGETAQGMFPSLAVQTMTNIVYESEQHFNNDKFLKFFFDNTFSSLPDNVKKLCQSLKEILEANKDIDVILVSEADVNEEILKAISVMRLKAPLFWFVSVSDVEIYCKDPDWSCSTYKKMKMSAGMTLYRGVNPVFVSGTEFKSSDLPTLFKDFVSIIQSYKPDAIYKYKFKRAVYLDGETWKLN